MARTNFITGFAAVLLLSTILGAQETQNGSSQQPQNGQQTQTGQPAQPTPSIYNRMRRMPGGEMGQPATQAQQFPNGAQQFPPDQEGGGMPSQRPPMTFPHATRPDTQQQTPQVQQSPQPGAAQSPQQQTVQQQPQAPTGQALKPANPPRISYAGGELTVVADNSSLAEILGGIQRATGSQIEGIRPDSERVFGQFGPGSPRDVLTSLLGGSRYDFILAGAVDDPGGVQRVILSPHGASPANTANAGGQRPPQQQEEEETNEAFTPPEPPQPTPMQPPVPSEQVQPPTQQPGQQQVKTPEQLLQELQRMRMQQQQPAPGTNPR